MEWLIVVVGYFPKERVFYAKIASNDARARHWKEKWIEDGGKVRVGKTLYPEGKRQEAYASLKGKLARQLVSER